MRINGIDYTARETQLRSLGIDPHGPMSQYGTLLGAEYVWCNQHKAPHRVDSSCTVNAIEKMPLEATGDFENALAECRAKGYRLTGEPFPCAACHQVVIEQNSTLVTVTDNSALCPKAQGSTTWHTFR